MMITNQTFKKNQQGAVLVISLIMLLLLSLTGTVGVQVSSLEEKMASNARDQNLAFQAAESALSAAEESLNPPNMLPSFDYSGVGGFYTNDTYVDISDSAISQASFWTSSPVATSNLSSLSNNIVTPLYFIQQLPASCFDLPSCTPSDLVPTFRIVVRATGGTTSAVVILQSLYTT